MEDINSAKQRVHKLMLTNRRTCTINGVVDVLSFDVREILLETDQGMLMLKGDDLHVNRLTLEKGKWMWTAELTALPIPILPVIIQKVNPLSQNYLSRAGVLK